MPKSARFTDPGGIRQWTVGVDADGPADRPDDRLRGECVLHKHLMMQELVSLALGSDSGTADASPDARLFRDACPHIRARICTESFHPVHRIDSQRASARNHPDPGLHTDADDEDFGDVIAGCWDMDRMSLSGEPAAAVGMGCVCELPEVPPHRTQVARPGMNFPSPNLHSGWSQTAMHARPTF